MPLSITTQIIIHNVPLGSHNGPNRHPHHPQRAHESGGVRGGGRGGGFGGGAGVPIPAELVLSASVVAHEVDEVVVLGAHPGETDQTEVVSGEERGDVKLASAKEKDLCNVFGRKLYINFLITSSLEIWLTERKFYFLKYVKI
jgi:hypothetical protein